MEKTLKGPRRARVRSVGPPLVLAAIMWAGSACGGSSPPPAPGQTRGVAPDLRGSRVIVLPVQVVSGVPGDPYSELVFTLTDRGRDVDWVLSDEVDEILARSPAVQARTRGLPVGFFLQAEVERVGDPLYGHLRRMAGLVDAQAVLLPVQASYEATPSVNEDVDAASQGTEVDADTEEVDRRVRLQAALIDPRTGRILWYGIEEGGDFDQDDPRGLASAVEELARSLLWYVGTD
jgi:hypothetical protein